MLVDDLSTPAEVETAIAEYESKYPFDADIFILKGNFLLRMREYEEARDTLKKGCEMYPYYSVLHYMLAKIYEELKEYDAINYYNAIKYYYIAGALDETKSDIWDESLNMADKLLRELSDMIEKKIESGIGIEEIRRVKLFIDRIALESENMFGRMEFRFRGNSSIIGECYPDDKEEVFVGAYRSRHQLTSDEKDLLNACGEFRRVKEMSSYLVENDAALLPVASREKAKLDFVQLDCAKIIKQLQRETDTFYYYRVGKGMRIQSDQPLLIGKEIAIRHDSRRKRMVMSIFVDGLAQQLLTKEGFEKVMPNTYHFFAEQGMVCTNAWTTGEWTLPSIAGIMSGLSTLKHQVFHCDIDYSISKDSVTIAERFQKAGYYTTILNGNWRIIPVYGMDRGFDSFLYRHQYANWRVEHIIGDAIEYIEAFKETDQYVWLSIGDLHHVADEDSLPLSVQTQMNLDIRQDDESGQGTSVKQGYSDNKRMQYEKMMGYVDRHLGILYDYLRRNYPDDEMVISLFSDHGQGYLVPEGSEFLSKERTNVSMMFRDGVHKDAEMNELLSTLDYGEMLCELAGAREFDNPRSEGMLPVSLGGEKRRFAVTESIHPHDPYQIALRFDDFTFFFRNPTVVQWDGRFELAEYEAYLKDDNGNLVEDQKLCEECTQYVLNRIAKYLIY
ncbi:MAG: sulfatase-like hydrolase/transferase [Lachnospiraceae bacterium]|nr:sulfatase-like hydrolase/transferase [Lachnospiraceae bacterium]